MMYERELFKPEHGMQLDHVICTTMSIDVCEIIRVLTLSNHYQADADARDDSEIKITQLMIDSMLMGDDKNPGWIDKFDFYYDIDNGGLLNGLPGYLSESVYNKIAKPQYLHPISHDTVFHNKLIMCRFVRDGDLLWKVMVTSHNLTLSRCYENAVLLESCKKEESDKKNHKLGELLKFIDKEKKFEKYIDELSKYNFHLYGDKNKEVDVELEISGLDGDVNKTPFFEPVYKDILEEPRNWRVVSPTYETGPVFQTINNEFNLIFSPVDDEEFEDTHAKIYFKVNDQGKCNEIWIGSANCSDDGLGGHSDGKEITENPNCNIECLVHLNKKDGFSDETFKLNENGFEYKGKKFDKVKSFTQIDAEKNSIISQIIKNYSLNMEYNRTKGNIPRMIVSMSKKDGPDIDLDNVRVKVLPQGYPEQHFTDITGDINHQKITPRGNGGFQGPKTNTASYVLRIVAECGYQKTERLWVADNIGNIAGQDIFRDDIYKNIIRFVASEYIGDDKEIRRNEFCQLWKSISIQFGSNPLKLNQLDRVLRNYLDAMEINGQEVDPCLFITSKPEGPTKYQTDAINAAYKGLTRNRKRFLVADEAGLGKTHIAIGVIKKFTANENKKKEPLRVIYFASNLFLLKSTADKLLKGNENDWETADDCDRVSYIRKEIESNNHQGKNVVLYLVSGNLYGENAKGEGKREEKEYLKKHFTGSDGIAELRKKEIKYLIECKKIDLIICDEFHRYADAAKEISKDWKDTSVLFMSATPYNWYNSQLLMDEGGFENGTALSKEDSDKGLSSFSDVLEKLLLVNMLKSDYNNLSDINNIMSSEDLRKLEEELKKYVWRNERIYAGREKRTDIPGKDVYLSEQYRKAVECRYEQEKDKKNSLFMQLFPGIYSFMCKGKYGSGEKYYQDLMKESINEDDFIFNKNNNVKENCINTNYKLSCIKGIQVDPQKDMLWITPVKSRYQPCGPFIKNATKLLVFSGYLMVPRGISTIFSQYVTGKTDSITGEICDEQEAGKAIERLKQRDQMVDCVDRYNAYLPEVDSYSSIPTFEDYLNKVLENAGQDIGEALYAIGSPYLIFRRMGAEHKDAVETANMFYGYLLNGGKRYVLLRALKNINSDYPDKILYYFCSGCLEDTFNEYYQLLKCTSFGDFKNKITDILGFHGVMVTALNSITYPKWKFSSKECTLSDAYISCDYAIPFTPDEDDSGAQLTSKTGMDFQKKEQNAFNSPFWPMILSTTSAGQEGIDMDAYCRRIMHYTVPYSPMAFEQRDGRIDRRKSLAAREKLNYLWGKYLNKTCPNDVSENGFWNRIYSFCTDESGLSPMWSLRETVDEIGLERIVPFLPGTEEYNAYKYLIDVKYQYRGAFGLPDEGGYYYLDDIGLKLNNIMTTKL